MPKLCTDRQVGHRGAGSRGKGPGGRRPRLGRARAGVRESSLNPASWPCAKTPSGWGPAGPHPLRRPVAPKEARGARQDCRRRDSQPTAISKFLRGTSRKPPFLGASPVPAGLAEGAGRRAGPDGSVQTLEFKGESTRLSGTREKPSGIAGGRQENTHVNFDAACGRDLRTGAAASGARSGPRPRPTPGGARCLCPRGRSLGADAGPERSSRRSRRRATTSARSARATRTRGSRCSTRAPSCTNPSAQRRPKDAKVSKRSGRSSPAVRDADVASRRGVLLGIRSGGALVRAERPSRRTTARISAASPSSRSTTKGASRR